MQEISWANRLELQNQWTNSEKGWQVAVEWNQGPYGVGLFAEETISEGTLMRQGVIGRNLVRFQGETCLYQFLGCWNDPRYPERLDYVADYLYGVDLRNDGKEDQWFYGIWLPGHGINHDYDSNIVFHAVWDIDDTLIGLNLHASQDIQEGQEILENYHAFGRAPPWLLEFKDRAKIDLNFVDCNSFVTS